MPFIPKLRDERHRTSVVPPSFAAQNRALVFPITGDDPSAHFLAAAPGRTPQRLTDRLAAGDRSSLGKAMIAELPVQSILSTPIYTIFRRNLQGKIAKYPKLLRPRHGKRGWRWPASFGYAVMGDGAQPTYFMPEFSVAVMSLTRLADHSEYALFIMALRTWTIQ